MSSQRLVKYCPFCGVEMDDWRTNEKRCRLCGCVTTSKNIVAGPVFYEDTDLKSFAEMLNKAEEFGPPIVHDEELRAVPIRAVILESGQMIYYSTLVKKWVPHRGGKRVGFECTRCGAFIPLSERSLSDIDNGWTMVCDECMPPDKFFDEGYK